MVKDYLGVKRQSKENDESYHSRDIIQTVNVNLDCFDKKENEKSAFRAVNNANQAVPANTFVKVLYQNEQFDLENEYNPATSTFVPREDGVYLIIGSISFLPNNTAINYRARVEIRINGVVNATIDNDFFGPIVFGNVVSVSSILRLQAGDTVEIFAQSSTAGTFTAGTVESATHFEAARLA